MKTKLLPVWAFTLLGATLSNCGDDGSNEDDSGPDSDSDSDSDTDSDLDSDTDGDHVTDATDYMSMKVALFGDGSCSLTGDFENTAVFGKTGGGDIALTATFPEWYPDVDLGYADDRIPRAIFIARLSQDGSAEWARVMDSENGNSGKTSAGGISTTATGDTVLTGSFSGNLYVGEVEPEVIIADDSDAFIAAFDSNGSNAFLSLIAGNDLTTDIEASASGIRIAGSYRYDAVLEPGGANETTVEGDANSGDFASFVAAYDFGGGLVWARNIAGAFSDQTSVSSDGISHVGGSYMEEGAIFNPGEEDEQTLSVQGCGAIVAAFSPDGVVSWASALGNASDRILDIKALAGGGALAIDNSSGPADDQIFNPETPEEFTLGSTGCFEGNFFLARLTANGVVDWAATGTCFDDEGMSTVTASSIAALTDGSTILVGRAGPMTALGKGEETETTFGSDTSFLARYRPDGTLAWARPIAGNAVSVDAVPDNGKSAVAGWFEGEVTFGAGEANETTLNGIDGHRFVAAYDPTGALVWVVQIGEG